jgi:hypothetical protein
MSISNPEWLTGRGGKLRPGVDGKSSVVVVDGKPQYLLTPIPAIGKYSCEVRQTVNGRRLESGGTYPSPEAALQGGLEDLRRALGW